MPSDKSSLKEWACGWISLCPRKTDTLTADQGLKMPFKMRHMKQKTSSTKLRVGTPYYSLFPFFAALSRYILRVLQNAALLLFLNTDNFWWLQYDFSGNDLHELDKQKFEVLSFSNLFLCVLSAVPPLHTVHLETCNS